MRYSLVFIIILIASFVSAQNKQILYNFDQLPQTLLLNPGEKVTQKWHTGVPLLSGISTNIGSTDLNVYDIFADDGTTINDKVSILVYNLKSKDYVFINEQVELFNIGIRLKNNKDFLSVGFYQEFDAIAYYPKDLAILFYEGNTNLNERYSFKQLNFKAEMLGVLHAGISREIDDDLQIGTRLKVYSGAFNMQTRRNKGVYYTETGILNQYAHVLEGVDGKFQSSGVFLPNGTEVNQSYFQNKLLLGGNLGLGFDVGFTYHPEKQWTVSGSILDVGFIYNSKDNLIYKTQGSYRFEGIEPVFNPPNNIDYWQELKDDFIDEMNYEETAEPYFSWRSIKINSMVKYEFGEDRFTDCLDTEIDSEYYNAVGAHLYTIFRPKSPQLAATVFYERKLSNGLSAKLTYTADSYSFSNIGLGVSARIGIFNIYGTADYLLGYQNLAKTYGASIQFGMNIIVP